MRIIGTISIEIMSLFWLYSLGSVLCLGKDTSSNAVLIFEGVFTAIDVLATIYISVLVIPEKKRKWVVMLLWISVFLLDAPLFVVTPIGSRCFFPSYVFLIMIACVLIETLLQNAESRAVIAVSVAGIAAMFVMYYVVFVQIFAADQARLNSIQNAISQGETSAELTHLPHEDYLWTSYPYHDNDIWEERYKLFYNIPSGFDLRLLR